MIKLGSSLAADEGRWQPPWLPIRGRVHGPEHPATRDNLAYWTGQAGDTDAGTDRLIKKLTDL